MARKARFDRQVALTNAMQLFWARGYHATSLKDIEAALDMRPGSIYAAFGSKEGLFKEALTLYADTTRARLEDTLLEAGAPIAGLAAHVRALGQQMGGPVPSRACMLMKTILETPDDDPVFRRAAEDLMRQTEAAFADAFRKAQRAGQINADHDPQRLASRLQAQILGLRAYAERSDTADRVPGLAEDIARDLEAFSA